MNFRAATGAILIALLLQGCAVDGTSNLEPVEPIVDREFVNVSTAPLVVKDAVRLGILSSADVAEAELGVQQSNNDVRIAKADFYPEFYANVSPGSGGGNIATAGAGLRYTVFDFGERTANLNGSIIGVEGSRYELMVEIEEIARVVVEQYILLSIQNQQVDTAVAYQKSVKSLEGAVRARVEIGIASGVDINEIESAMIQADTTILEARAEQSNALEGFSSTLGLTPGGVSSPRNIEQLLSIDRKDTDTLDFESFPRIAALSVQVQQVEFERDAVEAGLLPRIGVQLGLNVGLNSADGLTNQGATFGPEISEVISLGGGRQQQIENAQIAVQVAQRQRDEEIRLARLEVVQAQTTLSASTQQLAQRKEIVVLTIDTRDVMLGEYDVGTRSLRDLLDAEERIYQAQKEVNDARRNNLEALLRHVAATNRLSDTLFEISL